MEVAEIWPNKESRVDHSLTGCVGQLADSRVFWGPRHSWGG